MSEREGFARHDIIWSENRDEIFANRLANDIKRLQDAGFDDTAIKKMIGTLKYVRFWSQWPSWAFPVDKLPKGHKWADGERFSLKQNKKSNSESYTFLVVDDDLYIKSKNGETFMPGLNIKDKVFLRIIDFRSITANDFLSKIELTPFFHDCVLKFWKEHDGRLGYVEPLLKDRISFDKRKESENQT